MKLVEDMFIVLNKEEKVDYLTKRITSMIDASLAIGEGCYELALKDIKDMVEKYLESEKYNGG